MIPTKETHRILFLDNLRYLMVLGVVVLHSATSYSNIVPWWCVKEANQNAIFFDILLLLLDVFLMPVLYFIAGYFATPSFQSKGTRNFLKRKLKRLGLPLLIGIPLIGPSFSYIYHYTRNGFILTSDFSYTWFHYLKGAGDLKISIISSIDQFSHSHLWFMSLLLFFFIIFTLYGSRHKRMTAITPHTNSTTNYDKSIYIIMSGVVILSTLSAFLANLIFATSSNPDPWVTIVNLLQFQPVKVVAYMLFFVMGIVAFRSKWFIDTKIPGHPVAWALASLMLSACYLLLLKQLIVNPSWGTLFFYLLVRFFLCMSFLVIFVMGTVRFWNRPSRFHALLALNSYHIYMVHFLIVILIQLLLVGWSDGPVLMKFGIVTSASILVSYAISHYVIRPYPRVSVIGMYGLLFILLVTIKA